MFVSVSISVSRLPEFAIAPRLQRLRQREVVALLLPREPNNLHVAFFLNHLGGDFARFRRPDYSIHVQRVKRQRHLSLSPLQNQPYCRAWRHRSTVAND